MRLGADWKLADNDGDTLIHFACMKEVSHGQHEQTLDYLLQSPASKLMNVQNSNGDTPILVATRCVCVCVCVSDRGTSFSLCAGAILFQE